MYLELRGEAQTILFPRLNVCATVRLLFFSWFKIAHMKIDIIRFMGRLAHSSEFPSFTRSKGQRDRETG